MLASSFCEKEKKSTMIKRTVKYTDYDDVEKTEEFYFNISESELTKLDAEHEGGLRGILNRIVSSKDISQTMKMFEFIIHLAYGEKSPDGKHFWKRDKDGHDLASSFEQSAAYNQLFIDLLSDPDDAAKFINGMLPAKIQGAVPVEVQ